MSNLGSCLLATLPAWLSFLHLWLEAILLHRLVPTAHHITTPSEIRVHKKKKKIIKKDIGKYFSFSCECCRYDHLFIFCKPTCARVCVSLATTHLSSWRSERSPGFVCPFPACQTILNRKIHLLPLKAALFSYPWRSDVCSPFYHLSRTCFDCKHPDNALVSPSQVQ